MPRVTVIIPTFNRADLLPRAVESVLAQDYPDYELIVVDDGSTDATGEVLEAWRGRLRIVRHAVTRGVSAARNSGILASDSPLIALLDSDDYWQPSKLRRQVAFLDDHPGRGLCQTDEIWIRRGRRVNPRRKHHKPSGNIFTASLAMCLVSPSAVLLRRTLLDEVGLFDENLPACEDYDLWLRVSWRHEVPLIADPLVVKTGGHADQLSAHFPAMDRFRIYALQKLLAITPLAPTQREAARAALAAKCRIYAQGCRKRARAGEARYFETLGGCLAGEEEMPTLTCGPRWETGED